jgi:hypothetical protein
VFAQILTEMCVKLLILAWDPKHLRIILNGGYPACSHMYAYFQSFIPSSGIVLPPKTPIPHSSVKNDIICATKKMHDGLVFGKKYFLSREKILHDTISSFLLT